MQARDRFGRWLPDAAPAAVPTEVVEPVRAPDVAADVVVPALQAVLVAAAAAIGATLAVWLADVPMWGIPVAGGVALAAAIPTMLGHARETLWRTTTPVLPEPERPVQTVRLELSELSPGGGVKRMQILDLPVGPRVHGDDRLRTFARAALEGSSLSVHRWTPGAFTRHEYEVLSDELQRAGLLVVTRNGRRLTTAGRHVLRRLADP